MTQPGPAGGSWFQRYLLPGFAMKAVIIGGGYATGRELAEYFLPSGPWGGLAGMILAMLIWSLVAAVTFALAQSFGTLDYRSFFQRLLGPGWVVFEIAFLIFAVLILAVFGAAAGAIGAATFGWPGFAGSALLALAILLTTALGRTAVERLFKYASFIIYAVYALFLGIALARFGGLIGDGFAASPPPGPGWFAGGVTYAAYNIVGAVVILPVLRHQRSRREAAIAGLVAGPLAMLPAILFLVAMVGFYPAIAAETLPSDFLLRQMAVPGFALLFQLMIFVALVESGVGSLHAINERIAGAQAARGKAAPSAAIRALTGAIILAGCMVVAVEIGLITLIASGYRILAVMFLVVYVLPILTIGSYRLFRPQIPRESLS